MSRNDGAPAAPRTVELVAPTSASATEARATPGAAILSAPVVQDDDAQDEERAESLVESVGDVVTSLWRFRVVSTLSTWVRVVLARRWMWLFLVFLEVAVLILSASVGDGGIGLTWRTWVAFGVLCMVLVFMSASYLPTHHIMLAALLILLVTETINAEEALVGFNNHSVAAIAALFVVSKGLEVTGAFNWVMRRVLGRGMSLRWSVARLTLLVTCIGAFFLIIPLVAILIGIVKAHAIREGIRPGKLLLPLAYSAISAGACTLIGTSTNLIIAGLTHHTDPSIEVSLFGISSVAFPVALLSLLYIILFAEWGLADPGDAKGCGSTARTITRAAINILPSALQAPAQATSTRARAHRREYEFAVAVLPTSGYVGARLTELPMLRDAAKGNGETLDLVEVRRNGRTYKWAHTDDREAASELAVEAGDCFVFHGCTAAAASLFRFAEGFAPLARATYVPPPVKMTRKFEPKPHDSGVRFLVEAVLGPASPWLGRVPSAVSFGDASASFLVAVNHTSRGALGGDAGARAAESGSNPARILDEDSRTNSVAPAAAVPAAVLASAAQDDSREAPALTRDTAVLVADEGGQAPVRSDSVVPTVPDVTLVEAPLRAGDVLLIEASNAFVERQKKRNEFIFLSEVPDSRFTLLLPVDVPRALFATVLVVLMIIIVGLKYVDILVAALFVAAVFLLTGVLSPHEAGESVEVHVLLTIAAAFGVGEALRVSNAARAIAAVILHIFSPMGKFGILLGIFLGTSSIAHMVGEKATCVLMFPIAVEAAQSFNIPLISMAYILMLASSTAFMTPVAHVCNLMVMKPGELTNADYLKFGAPLQVIKAAAAIALCHYLYVL